VATTENTATRTIRDARKHLWLQFTDVERLDKMGLLVMAKADMAILRDVEGREYIDGLAGLFTTQVGHGREEIARAVADQLTKLDFVSLFGFAHEPAIELAARLAELTPGDLSVVNFANSGSEAVEVAIKIARQYHYIRGERNRVKIIARAGAFHGVTFGALSATGVRLRRAPYEPLVPGFVHVPPPDGYHTYPNLSEGEVADAALRALEETLDFEGPDTVAAMIVDPIMAAIGVIVPPACYLPRLKEICDRHRILLIIDEVLTGFGRSGKLFACEHWGVVPDIMTMAKGLSSGYQPIAATIVTEKIAEPFEGSYFQHGQTFSGHPAGCRAALTNLAIIEREHLVKNAADVGDYLLSRLQKLRDLPLVGDVRGKGLLLGIELVSDKKRHQKFPDAAEVGFRVRDRAIELGLICRSDNDCIILAPPLILDRIQADRIAEILAQAIAEVGQSVE